MPDTLIGFYWLSIGSAVSAIFTTILIFLVALRRKQWLRFTAAEVEFNVRMGMSKRVAEKVRRFEESRLAVYFLFGMLACFLFLTVVTARSYAQLKHERENPPPVFPTQFR